MSEIPESLLRRSAEAKAKALGLPFEQVLAEMKGETAPTSAIEASSTDTPSSDESDTDSGEEKGGSAGEEVGTFDRAQTERTEVGEDTTGAAATDGPSSVVSTDPEPTVSDTTADEIDLDLLATMVAEAAQQPEAVVRRDAAKAVAEQGIDLVSAFAQIAKMDLEEISALRSQPTTSPDPGSETPILSTADPEELIVMITASSSLPEVIVRRSAEAKAKAQGVTLAEALAEMAGGRLPDTTEADAVPPTDTEEPTAETEPVAADEPSVDQPSSAEPTSEPPPPDSSSDEDRTTEPSPPVITTSEPVETATGTATSATEVTAPVTATVAVADSDPDPSPNGHSRGATIIVTPTDVPHEDLPDQVRIHRLLAIVRARAIQQVKAEPTDKVTVWPHLLLVEFVALLVMTAFVILLSVILQAPLLEAANPNLTPNPSKAPWYFLGLQELLSYFDPQIAGVTVPTLAGLFGFMMIPYIDRNPSTKPSDRKFAIMLYTIFLMGSATLTILGVLFRGQGFNFSYPWRDGVFFDDLKDWVHFE